MSGHTPGPWFGLKNGKYDNSKNTWDLQDEDASCSQAAPITTDSGDIVAFVVHSSDDFHHDSLIESNARLIAAAPELLAGLKKMLDNEEQRVFEKWLLEKTPSGDVSSVQGQWLDSSEYEDFLETWAFQIAAIAKARGTA